MLEAGVLEKHSFPEIHPREEYECTDLGKGLIKIHEDLEDLQKYYDPDIYKKATGCKYFLKLSPNWLYILIWTPEKKLRI